MDVNKMNATAAAGGISVSTKQMSSTLFFGPIKQATVFIGAGLSFSFPPENRPVMTIAEC